MTDDIGDRFQKETKYDRSSIDGSGLDRSKKPEIYKEYSDCDIAELPSVKAFDLPSEKTLGEVLKTRRSVRQFSSKSMSIGHLSYLLWASTGITL